MGGLKIELGVQAELIVFESSFGSRLLRVAIHE
jgi:hypothetical protein